MNAQRAVRAAVWTIAAIGVAALVRALLRSRSRREFAAGASGPRFEGAMVRDRICRTFLPRSRALVLRLDDEEHFFCSAGCRMAFLERRRPTIG